MGVSLRDLLSPAEVVHIASGIALRAGMQPYTPTEHEKAMMAERASEKLAALLRNELGCAVSAAHLRTFVRGYWRELSAYAHAINAGHEAEDDHREEAQQDHNDSPG